jgi:hypothetical protein
MFVRQLAGRGAAVGLQPGGDAQSRHRHRPEIRQGQSLNPRPSPQSVCRTRLCELCICLHRPLPLAPPVSDFYLDVERALHAGHLVVLCGGLPSLVVRRRGNPIWY